MAQVVEHLSRKHGAQYCPKQILDRHCGKSSALNTSESCRNLRTPEELGLPHMSNQKLTALWFHFLERLVR
jgi:hypothetical protein